MGSGNGTLPDRRNRYTAIDFRLSKAKCGFYGYGIFFKRVTRYGDRRNHVFCVCLLRHPQAAT